MVFKTKVAATGLMAAALIVMPGGVSCCRGPSGDDGADVECARNDQLPPLDVPQYEEWPFDENEAKRRQEETAARLGVSVEGRVRLKDQLCLDLVLVPTGRFIMGFQGSEGNEPHEARVSRPFYIGKYEVTWRQYAAFPQSKGAHLTNLGLDNARKGSRGELDWAVDGIEWVTCNRYCRDVSKALGCAARLPRELEWEYACRAGTTGRFVWGETRDSLYTDGHRPEGAAWELIERTNTIGLLRPNPWGIHDMIGNAGEWVCDEYNDDPWSRTIRGESGLDRDGFAARYPGIKTGTGPYVGFRMVFEIDAALVSLLKQNHTLVR